MVRSDGYKPPRVELPEEDKEADASGELDCAVGMVTHIYPPRSEWFFFRLDDETRTPKSNYYQVMQTHANYKEVYSLLLAAAINRLTVNVRATADITEKNFAEVADIWVNW